MWDDLLSGLWEESPDEAYEGGYKEGYRGVGSHDRANYEREKGIADGKRDRLAMWEFEAEDWRL